VVDIIRLKRGNSRSLEKLDGDQCVLRRGGGTLADREGVFMLDPSRTPC
jgi:hypothetical protein